MLALATLGAPWGCARPTGAPILYVTQVPANQNGDATRGGGANAVTGTFGNHDPTKAPRGGDLEIVYPDGTVRSLTTEAGYGAKGALQGDDAIAVRQPCVHWDGEKALFSMVVGAQQSEEVHWQIYEVTGLGQGDVASIRRVEGQPEEFDNVSPVYGVARAGEPSDPILFTSTLPPTGEPELVQLDEYESSPTVSGIFRMVEGAEPVRIEHAPSGAFGLFVDSFDRVLYTRWDHLQRDQQGDNPRAALRYHPLTYSGEALDSAYVADAERSEVFPEARTADDPTRDPGVGLHTFSQFYPWQVDEEGTREETLVHVGRQELGGAPLTGSFLDDDALSGDVDPSQHANLLRMIEKAGFFQLREDPTRPGTLYATYAYEFFGAGGGALVRLTAAPDDHPDGIVVEALTPLEGFDPRARTGTYRSPLPTSDGGMIASYTSADGPLDDDGLAVDGEPFGFRLWALVEGPSGFTPARRLTTRAAKLVLWEQDGALHQWSGEPWELDPVEVAPRPRPAPRLADVDAVEAGVFDDAGVDKDAFAAWLAEHDWALLVSRNVTRRDRADVQQPFNLEVRGGPASVSTAAPDARSYELRWLQVFQADLIRGYADDDGVPLPGRRVLARPSGATGAAPTLAPSGATRIAADGSFAAIVPARRAVTWQTLDPDGAPVVRERYWVTLAPGEIRSCPACHGINTLSQSGEPTPTNAPLALRELLVGWEL